MNMNTSFFQFKWNSFNVGEMRPPLKNHITPKEFKNAALFLRLSLPSTLIRHENAALLLQLGLPSTLIRHENVALFLRLGLPSTLIRRGNGALFLRLLGQLSTLIRHENAALFLWFGLPSTLIRHGNGAPKRSSKRRNLKAPAQRFSVDGKRCFK